MHAGPTGDWAMAVTGNLLLPPFLLSLFFFSLFFCLLSFVFFYILFLNCVLIQNYTVDKGKVFAWGEGQDFRTGLGGISRSQFPRMVEFPSPVKGIALGYSHGIAVTEDYGVFTWYHPPYLPYPPPLSILSSILSFSITR